MKSKIGVIASLSVVALVAVVIGLSLAGVVYLALPKVQQLYAGYNYASAVPPTHVPAITVRQMSTVPSRPNYPGQVDLEDLHVGQVLYQVHRGNPLMTVVIVKAPYYNGDDCMFDTVWWENNAPDTEFIWTNYCEDFGLVPYQVSPKVWNAANYLRTTGEVPLTLEEVQDVIEDLRYTP